MQGGTQNGSLAGGRQGLSRVSLLTGDERRPDHKSHTERDSPTRQQLFLGDARDPLAELIDDAVRCFPAFFLPFPPG